MLTTSLKTNVLAAVLAFGTMTGLSTAPAQADSLSVGIEIDLGVQDVGYRGGRRARGYRGYDDGFRPSRRRGCRPHRALQEARRLGVRHAYISEIGPRGTIVRGRRWGGHVSIGFGRVRGCPVVFANYR